VTTTYLDLGDWVVLAARATGMSESTVLAVADLGLADSALNAPAASFGGVEFYPTIPLKAAVLIEHLVKAHALPDGNKRTAWLSGVRFMAVNGWQLHLPAHDADTLVDLLVALAAGQLASEKWHGWLAERMYGPR